MDIFKPSEPNWSSSYLLSESPGLFRFLEYSETCFLPKGKTAFLPILHLIDIIITKAGTQAVMVVMLCQSLFPNRSELSILNTR